jgi:hypothetical protein
MPPGSLGVPIQADTDLDMEVLKRLEHRSA